MKKRSTRTFDFFSPISAILLIVAIVGMLLAGWLLPLRVFVGSALIAAVISSVVLIRLIRSHDFSKSNWPLLLSFVICIASVFGLIYNGFSYAFVEETFIPFWEVALILGLLVSVFVTVKWAKNSKWGAKIGIIFGLTLIVSIFSVILVSHLNFLLDFHEPVEHTARIEEKDVHRHSKSPDEYIFEVVVDGKSFDLEVSFMEYDQYEEGDYYTFKEYKGAFGKSFYISD